MNEQGPDVWRTINTAGWIIAGVVAVAFILSMVALVIVMLAH